VSLSLDHADGVPFNENGDWNMESGPDEIYAAAHPGSWWLSASLQRRGLCVGSLTGGIDPAREPLTVGLATAPQPIELTLRDDCATLVLSLPPAQATFLPGEEPFFTVYIVPDFATIQDIPPMSLHPSSGPSLMLDGLTPGSYHVYTFDSPVHLEYRDPSAMAALSTPGQQVTLAAGTSTNLVLEAPQH
jgi:hypothetical protein